MTQFIGMRAHIHGIGRQWPVPFSELCTLRAAGTIRPRTWDSASRCSTEQPVQSRLPSISMFQDAALNSEVIRSHQSGQEVEAGAPGFTTFSFHVPGWSRESRGRVVRCLV